jgi:predicted amidohydrolase YtcJ
LTRADLDGNDAWNVEETVDLATAIRAATWGSAYANLVERDRGTIAPGMRADLAVLSRDVMALDDPRDLLTTTADVTIVGGVVAFRRDR